MAYKTKELERIYRRKRYAEKKDILNAQKKKYRSTRIEFFKEYQRYKSYEFFLKNKEKPEFKSKVKQYREKMKPKLNVYMKKYRE